MKRRSPKHDELERANRDAYFKSTKPHGPLHVTVGEVVGYSRYFCMSIGLPPTDPMWRTTGKVTELRDVFALVLFEDRQAPQLVRLEHLAKPGPNIRWAE